MNAQWFIELMRNMALVSLLLPFCLAILMGYFLRAMEKEEKKEKERKIFLDKLSGKRKEF
jgi:hypothetical protein